MKAVVIGAGIGGLATAIRLRVQGYEVQVYEAGAQAGGKLNELHLQGFRFDAGPSLFTLPELVSELFCLAGREPGNYFSYELLPELCRYFFEDGSCIRAFSQPEAFAEEIEQKTGESAAKVKKFLQKSQRLYELTAHVFLHRSLHKLSTYLRADTLRSMLRLHQLDAFRSMHQANRSHFQDERLVQMFDRFATYNGSNPYRAPATLNIIPHLEHNLGAFFPTGGMYRIAQSLYKLACELGVVFHFNHKVEQIVLADSQQVKGVQVKQQVVPADVVVSNMDIVPTYRKLLPQLSAPEKILRQPRSSSALIFYWGMNTTFDELDVHNVFFSKQYEKEFEAVWEHQSIWHDPTVYLYVSAKKCPQDAPPGKENWFVMINVPPDTGQNWPALAQQARSSIIHKLSRMLGRDISRHIVCESVLDPPLIASRTSSYQGALYGNSSNNRWAAFLRHPNFSRRLKGLYFCGGSVHPGGGIPLCLLSAKIVGDLVAADG